MTQPNQAPPVPTAEQLAAAREMIASQETGLGPAPGGADATDVGAQLAAGQAAAGVDIGGTEVDADKLLAAIHALQARVESLETEKRAQTGDPLVNTVASLSALLQQHKAMAPAVAGHDDAASMADDLTDAAANASQSGDVSSVEKIAAKIEKWLARAGNPGPGDNPYYAQALDFARYHVPEAAANVTPPTPDATAELASTRPPAKVLQGNVTG